MLKVALTGGIATGKTYVVERLRQQGVPTIDADDLVHEAFEPDTPTTHAVALAFGPGVLNSDGRVNRRALASTVFADADARVRLEAIVHPQVYEKIDAWFLTRDEPVGVASIPLLFETHREADFDRVIVTACTAAEQLRRTLARGLSEEEAKHRLAAQIPTEEKIRRADYVIRTDGTFSDTDAQVDEMLNGISR
jgi:dephospho-CoA kinase